MRCSSRSSAGYDDEFGSAIDSLKLTDAQWLSLVAEVDRESSRHRGNKDDRRQHERMPYRNTTYLVATVRGGDGREQRFLVRTHDISETGLGFLHGNFIYPGSSVELVLKHRTYGQTYHTAVVRRCVHYKRHIHQIGIEFDEPIRLDDYLLVQREVKEAS